MQLREHANDPEVRAELEALLAFDTGHAPLGSGSQSSCGVGPAAARIAGKFDAQPQVEASIRQTIGTVYYDLGLFTQAQQQLERELSIQRGTLR